MARKKKAKPVIPPLPEECTDETCKVPRGCNETVIGSLACLKMREKHYGNKK